MTRQHPHHRSGARGSVIIIVLWAIAVAAIITSSVQLFAQRQATLGREALDRAQARWAARAGIENMLEVMTQHTEKPVEDDALAMFRDLEYFSRGAMINASYDIRHQADGRDWLGPVDEHSKININRTGDRGLLLVLDDMTLDVLDAIGDWMDTDSDVSTMGVERDYYRALNPPYEPRNGLMHSLGEVELVAGIWPKYFRGEDWNLNGRLDPNENDGGRSFPPDVPDGILDEGWAGKLTVYSVAGGASASGLPRIHLADAEIKDLQKRLSIDAVQAQALIDFGSRSGASLTDLIFSPLGSGGQIQGTATPQPVPTEAPNGQQNPSNQSGNSRQSGGVTPLTDKQLRAVLAETIVEDPATRTPGKINLNTVSAQLFRDMIQFLGMDDAIADEIIHMRDSRPEGITSMVDLQKVPNITTQDLQNLTQRFDVTSNVFTISSRGRSWGSGLEVEIIAVVDRSTVPVQILEYREQ